MKKVYETRWKSKKYPVFVYYDTETKTRIFADSRKFQDINQFKHMIENGGDYFGSRTYLHGDTVTKRKYVIELQSASLSLHGKFDRMRILGECRYESRTYTATSSLLPKGMSKSDLKYLKEQVVYNIAVQIVAEKYGIPVGKSAGLDEQYPDDYANVYSYAQQNTTYEYIYSTELRRT